MNKQRKPAIQYRADDRLSKGDRKVSLQQARTQSQREMRNELLRINRNEDRFEDEEFSLED